MLILSIDERRSKIIRNRVFDCHDLSPINFFENFFSGTLSVLSVLFWFQTVCKGYPQMTEVAARKERVKCL